MHSDGNVKQEQGLLAKIDRTSLDLSTSEEAKPTKGETTAADEPSSTTLHRSGYILLIVLLYSTLAILSWTIICIQTYRPINAKYYGFDNRLGEYSTEKYVRNEEWYRAMRVLQSVVATLTIPVTSAVCSAAAVAFVQTQRCSTIRKTMMLADRGWTSPSAYKRLLIPSQWKRSGSSFLLVAIALTILGGIIQPLQQIFISQKSIRTPRVVQQLYSLVDIPDQFVDQDLPDDGLVVLMTRNALAATTEIEPFQQLWQGNNYSCSSLGIEGNGTAEKFACGYGATLGQWSLLSEPFLAQLPSSFNSGLIKQFIPRINSSATYETVEADLFPSGCYSDPNDYFVRYESPQNITSDPWYIEICMPGDLRKSPWKSTRARQDFTERAYFNMSLAGSSNSSFYMMTVNTTSGYFELPSYLNDGIPGPLLPTDPNDFCDNSCWHQGILGTGVLGQPPDIWDHNVPSQANAFEVPYVVFNRHGERSTPRGQALVQVSNKGPLFTIILALFGYDSFLSQRINNPQSFTYNSNSSDTSPNGTCVDFAPLHFLLQESSGFTDWSGLQSCIVNNVTDEADVQTQLVTWLSNFDNRDNAAMANALNGAAFLANKAWLENQVRGHTLGVSYDEGIATPIPAISLPGMIFISVLYGVFHLGLLVIAAYAAFTPVWTRNLNSFAMMRLGGAVAQKVPLAVGRKEDEIEVLDSIPGWIGDQHETADVGSLALGARTALRRGRRYECYSGDDEEHQQRPQTRTRDEYTEIRMEQLIRDWRST